MGGVSFPLEVVYRKVADLRAYERNARSHPAAQIEAIAASITQFGFTNPILLDESGTIIAGHGRLEAAKRLGLVDVPTITLGGLSDAQRRALVIADNRIAESSGWDVRLLGLELADLQESGFDLGLLGFSDKELGDALRPSVHAGLTDPDDAPPITENAVSRPGDMWLCGAHRVVCGDAADRAQVSTLLDGALADVVWTDPPYNVDYVSKKTGRIANDDIDDGQFNGLLSKSFSALSEVMAPGAAIYVAHADTEGLAFRSAFVRAGFKLASCLIWRKDTLVLGRSDYQWIHEPVLYGWKPGGPHRWYGGRKQVTLQSFGEDSPFIHRPDGKWQLAIGDRVFIVNGEATVEEHVPSVIRHDKPRKSDLHPTMKPVELIERFLRNSARAGHIVVDTFSGSGSTLMAAERLGMVARVMDLDPRYVDVAVNRWQNYTGRSAVRGADGMEFNQCKAESLSQPS